MFAEGVSKVGELVDLGVEKKIVDKAGAWYSYNEERLGQGREAVKTFLKSNPDIAQEVERKIREQAGLVKPAPVAEAESATSGKKAAAAK